MGKKIICESCGTIFPFEKAKDFTVCPVCNASFDDREEANASVESPKETTKWYFYKGLSETLTDTLYDDEEPLYTFDAVDVEDAKRQLKEVLPSSPLINDNSPDIVRCPRCNSTQIQMVPRKFSLLTGFATNRIDRVCVRCQKRF